MDSTGRDRHDSKCKVTSSRNTTYKVVASVDVGHNLMSVTSVTVRVGCWITGVGTYSSLEESDAVTTVTEAASFTSIVYYSVDTESATYMVAMSVTAALKYSPLSFLSFYIKLESLSQHVMAPIGFSLKITSFNSSFTFFLEAYPVYASPHTTHSYTHIHYHLLFLL